MVADVSSFVCGQWVPAQRDPRMIASAINGRDIFRVSSKGLDFGDVLRHARSTGGPAIRQLSFHDRARALKALALWLDARKTHLYKLSHETGATLADSKIDIDGGIATLFVYASKARREMPDDVLLPDGDLEVISRNRTFLGQHYCTPFLGAAVHINAFNFPVWGLLEKFAPAFLAGMPTVAKPASVTCYLTEACVRLMDESGLLPQGSLQLIAGDTGDLLDRLADQDVVSFTGSAATAQSLRSQVQRSQLGTRFISEQDSLNASVLGTDAGPDSPEFEIFVSEAIHEITSKAGQKCTAIRRLMVPESLTSIVIAEMRSRLEELNYGDPGDPRTDVGALVSKEHRADVLENARKLQVECQNVFGDGSIEALPSELFGGAFLGAQLLYCDDPLNAAAIHDVEAFGPVATVMPYSSTGDLLSLLCMGRGSLVASVMTNDPRLARELLIGAGSAHGRFYFNNRDSQHEATGHGAPLPHMLHGGPGRAGGGTELGGLRGVKSYMQTVAVQASPDFLTTIGNRYVSPAKQEKCNVHPFRQDYDALEIGSSIETASRKVTLEDIEHFTEFTGDSFYAHTDEDAASANPFFPGRVAHGYLLLSFAAGLFVDPDPGPVLANTGLRDLDFLAPVVPGDTLRARLTVQSKKPRTDDYGEVSWLVELSNQRDEAVMTYTLLTMVARTRQ